GGSFDRKELAGRAAHAAKRSERLVTPGRILCFAACAARTRYCSAIDFTERTSGPVYRARGRINRLLSSCSMTWALQPATRDITKIGVYSGTSRPSAWYSPPPRPSQVRDTCLSPPHPRPPTS